MQDVFVATSKISYLRECLNRYNGNTGYLVLYFALLIYILIRGNEKERKIFIPMSVLMIATVYNPVFPHILSIFADINSEYYRFFWMTPIIVLVPYVMTKLILEIIDGNIKHKWLTAIVAILIITSASNSIFKSGITLPENKYKIPNEVIAISEIIHADSDKEYPKAFLEFENNMEMRQYDAKMLLTIDREDYLYTISSDYTQEMIDSEEFPQYRLLAALIRYQNVDINKVIEALETTDTEYVVLTTGSTMIPVLTDAGLYEVGQTNKYTILKYDQQDITPFELVDYSEVYKNGW